MASIVVILSYVYYDTISLLEQQDEETIRADVLGLTDQYRVGGVAGILETIERRNAQKSEMLYMLADPSGNHIAGNLVSLPINSIPDDSWFDFKIKSADKYATADHTAHGYNVQLPDGYQLVVARDVEDIRVFRDRILYSLYWGLGFAVVIGLGVGTAFSRSFLRRVDSITNTSQKIMNGNLSDRMPISGSGDELDRLAHSLNDMLNKIELLMQGMREVSGNVAHDLKTPLTRMRARLEDALRGEDKDAQRHALEQNVHDCDNLLATFNALLSITQLEAGQQRTSLENLDAFATLADVVELYEPLAEENHGTIQLRAQPGLIIKAKRELMAQALTNLLDNALKYGASKDGGTHIIVSGRIEQSNTVISVSDQGAGIPEKDRTRVLDRFVRLDESRTKPGNGLGLSLVSGIATLLGGKLILQDNNPGLKAELHLPYAG